MAHKRGFLGTALLIAVFLALSGCASVVPTLKPGEGYLKAHYVLADEDGYALSTDKSKGYESVALCSKEAREEIHDQIIAGVDGYIQYQLPKKETLQLMVYAHGGLNGYKEDFKRMQELMAKPADCDHPPDELPLFASAECKNAKTHVYPIFIDWNSDFWNSFWDELLFVRRGHRLEGPSQYEAIDAPLVVAGRVAGAVFDAGSIFTNVGNLRETDLSVPESIIAAGTAPVQIVMTPALKSFGTPAWEMMQRRAGLLSSKSLRNYPKCPVYPEKEPREGVAWSLISELSERIEPNDDGITASWRCDSCPDDKRKVRIELTLVGHSMGAIVLNRILIESRDTKILVPLKRVIYLASADNIKTTQAVKLLNHDKQNVVFWNFTLNRRDELREQKGFYTVPRGSLLIWIDSYFVPVKELEDKRAGAAKTYSELLGVTEKDRYFCEWRLTKDARPLEHGDLNKPMFVEAALRHVDQCEATKHQKLFVTDGPDEKDICEKPCPSEQPKALLGQ